MKTTIIRLLFLAGFCAAFYSCQKDQSATKPITSASPNLAFRSDDCDCDAVLDAIVFDGEMFHFDDYSSLQATEHCLAQLVDEHLAAFTAEYGHLADDAYNEVAEELQFDENEPLIAFEEQRGINSLRAAMEAEVNQWLDEMGPEFDFGSYPDDYMIMSDPLRTLINADGNIQIAGQSMNYTALRKASKPEDDGKCKSNIVQLDTFAVSANQRIIVKASSFDAVFWQRVASRVENYEWIRNKWRKRRTTMTAEVGGQYREIHCTVLYEQMYDIKTKRARNVCVGDSFGRSNGQGQGRLIQGNCWMEGIGTLGSTVGRVCL